MVEEASKSSIIPKRPHEGRRSNAVVLQWKQILRQYWESGVSPQTAHESTKPKLERLNLPPINLRTVYIYFRDWTEQYLESQGKEQREREEAAKVQAQVVLDKQLMILQQAQKDLETQIKAKKELVKEDKNGFIKLTMSSYVHQERRAMTAAISDLLRLKVDIMLSPTLTQKLELEIDSFIEKQQSR